MTDQQSAHARCFTRNAYTYLLHLSHLNLEPLNLGVQLLESAQIRLSKCGHFLLGSVPDHRQAVLMRFLAVMEGEADGQSHKQTTMNRHATSDRYNFGEGGTLENLPERDKRFSPV